MSVVTHVTHSVVCILRLNKNNERPGVTNCFYIQVGKQHLVTPCGDIESLLCKEMSHTSLCPLVLNPETSNLGLATCACCLWSLL